METSKEALSKFSKMLCTLVYVVIPSLYRSSRHNHFNAMVELWGQVGPNRVFWEEQAWANKRIMPGYVPRTGVKVLQDILRVTPESFTACVKLSICVYSI